MGCKQLYVATDHKPLVAVLGDQSLADVQNPRLARIKEKTLWWQFTILHTPGKLQLAADALSRRKGATVYTVSVHEPIDDEENVMEDIKYRFHPLFPDSASIKGLGEESTGRVRPKGFHKPGMVSKRDAIPILGQEEASAHPSCGRPEETMATANYVMNGDEISVITWDKLREVAE